MKYFKEKSGEVFAFEDDVSSDCIPSSLVPMTAEEIDAHLAQYAPSATAQRIDELLAQLDSIDTQSARPLRAIVAGTATDDDRAKLAGLEAAAAAARTELATLQSPA